MPFKINTVTKSEFLKSFYSDTPAFMRKIHAPEIFVVKEFYKKEEILGMRAAIFTQGTQTPPAWHPLYDGCPDFHRIHDDYEKAYVKGKIHVFYHHGYYPTNAELMLKFDEIFQMKNHLADDGQGFKTDRIPSDGLIARVNFHQYPRGGGYQAEHIDPHGVHARIQTLVVASEFGIDFKSGGLFARERVGGQKFYIDPYTEAGDLIVLSPAIPHGVDPVDADKSINWNSQTGRWIVLPLFVWSDYPHPDNIKPVQVDKTPCDPKSQ
jgi:hypothetical protein